MDPTPQEACDSHVVAFRSVEDLLNVDRLIGQVNNQRERLALQLRTKKNEEEDLLEHFVLMDVTLATISEEISKVKSVEDIKQLREKHGNLQILDRIAALLQLKEKKLSEKHGLDELQQICRELDKVDDHQDIEMYEKFQARITSLACDDTSALGIVYAKFNKLLEDQGKTLSAAFEHDLLHSKWDTNHFLFAEKSIKELRQQSTKLYRLNMLLLPQPNLNDLWNFHSIANNFKIKFIYHFNSKSQNELQSVEMYFEFLDKYLEQNLFRCIEIFYDEHAGVTQELIHRQFINHILDPIRHKINSSLIKISETPSQENLKMMMVLISQIFINDNALVKKHYYDGVGLASLIPDTVLETWLNFETDSTKRQYDKLTSASLEKNGTDFRTLLQNLYSYFEPFYNIEYERFLNYKIKITNQIFMELPDSYRRYVLNFNEERGSVSKSEEAKLEENLWKLQNLITINKTLMDFENKVNFIDLTSKLNHLTDSSYRTLFQEVQQRYEQAINTARDSIVHRIKRKLSSLLRVYFKLNNWSSVTSSPEQCSSELVGAINAMNKIVASVQLHELSGDVVYYIKIEVLNVIIHFILDYVVKLNKFSEMGLKQLIMDYESLKGTLKLEMAGFPTNAEEGALLETVEILKLKYQHDKRHENFINRAYIDRGDFRDFKKLMKIRYSIDGEIADAMYRIL